MAVNEFREKMESFGMKGTYLVQRLDSPPKSEWSAKAAQVFGGHFMQLSAEGWKTLQQIFNIHYMGAAEYEFGTLPKCLTEMVGDNKELVAFEVVVAKKDIKPNWDREMKHRRAHQAAVKEAKRIGAKIPKAKKLPGTPNDATIYVLCREKHREGATYAITQMAGDNVPCKEGHDVPRALDPIEEWDSETHGWLELDNGFFFFIDKTMWERTCDLFGVAHDVQQKPSEEEKSPSKNGA